MWRREPVDISFNQDKILLLLGNNVRLQDFLQRQALITKHGKPSSFSYLHLKKKSLARMTYNLISPSLLLCENTSIAFVS